MCLDDWLRAAESREQAVLHTSRLKSNVQSLGFIINQEKSCLTPLQRIPFLSKSSFSIQGEGALVPALLGPI